MPTRIVTTHYRYKRPPRKRKAVPLEGPAIVGKRASRPLDGTRAECSGSAPHCARQPTTTGSRRSSPRSARGRGIVDVPDMTPEEHRRRGDAADALFREMVRRAVPPEAMITAAAPSPPSPSPRNRSARCRSSSTETAARPAARRRGHRSLANGSCQVGSSIRHITDSRRPQRARPETCIMASRPG